MPLIAKDEPLFAIKLKDGVSEFGIRLVRIKQHEASTHPQVRDQGPLIIEIEKNEFPAPMDRADLRVSQP
jgi:hypothetical protein